MVCSVVIIVSILPSQKLATSFYVFFLGVGGEGGSEVYSLAIFSNTLEIQKHAIQLMATKL